MTTISKKTINLVVDNETGGEDLVPKIIKKVRIGQIEDALKVILSVVKTLENEPALKDVFTNIFNPQKEKVDLDAIGKMTDEELEAKAAADKKAREAFVMQAMFNSMKTLLATLPTQALELISALTKIHIDLLREQEPELVLEIIETIFQVNDIEAIIERGKQSFKIATSTMTFLNKKGN